MSIWFCSRIPSPTVKRLVSQIRRSVFLNGGLVKKTLEDYRCHIPQAMLRKPRASFFARLLHLPVKQVWSGGASFRI